MRAQLRRRIGRPEPGARSRSAFKVDLRPAPPPCTADRVPGAAFRRRDGRTARAAGSFGQKPRQGPPESGRIPDRPAPMPAASMQRYALARLQAPAAVPQAASQASGKTPEPTRYRRRRDMRTAFVCGAFSSSAAPSSTRCIKQPSAAKAAAPSRSGRLTSTARGRSAARRSSRERRQDRFGRRRWHRPWPPSYRHRHRQ
jgi:hypothetical protein